MRSALNWELIAGFVLVFLAGGATGVFVSATTAHYFFGAHHHGFAAQAMKNRLQWQLRLTDEQMTKIAPIIEKTGTKLEEIRGDTGRRVRETIAEAHHHLEGLVILVFANFACRHITNVSHFGVLVAVSESTYSFEVMCRVEVMCRRSTSPKNLQSQQLVKFLRSPATYPHRPPKVRAIQTHISWVFIASPLVFKIKKPVNLGFLDFSTLEKRHHFCQREVELNRRLCPEIYLGVVPIYKTDSCFSFEPPGDIAEYAVKMKELPHGW